MFASSNSFTAKILISDSGRTFIVVVMGSELFESNYSDGWLRDQCIGMTCPLLEYPFCYKEKHVIHTHLLPKFFN